jgi:hypothetical protein
MLLGTHYISHVFPSYALICLNRLRNIGDYVPPAFNGKKSRIFPCHRVLYVLYVVYDSVNKNRCFTRSSISRLVFLAETVFAGRFGNVNLG